MKFGDLRTTFPVAARGRFLHVALFGFLLGVVVLTRTLGWANWSLWLDETMQADYARRSVLEIIKVSLWDQAHPPLSYLVTALALRISSSDAVLRLPSIIFSVGAAMAIFVAIGGFRRFRSAYPAAALFAVLPVAVHYGQEIRPYAQALFFVALGEAARVRLAEAGSRAALVAQLIGATGAIYSLYFAVFPIAAGFALEFVFASRTRDQNKARFRRAIGLPVAVLLLYLPWVVALSRQPRRSPEAGAPTVTARLVVQFATGLASDRFEASDRATPAVCVWLVAALGLLAAKGQRGGMILQFAACFVAPLLFLSLIGHWWNLRYILLAVLPLCHAFGEGVGFLAERSGDWLLYALVSLAAAAQAPALADNVRSARPDWRRPAAYLQAQFQEGVGGSVVAGDGWSWWVLRFQTLRLERPIDVNPIVANADDLRRIVEEKREGWIIRTPHYVAPGAVDDYLKVVAPRKMFPRAEDARLYRFENGLLVN
jgi:hypothetical protein